MRSSIFVLLALFVLAFKCAGADEVKLEAAWSTVPAKVKGKVERRPAIIIRPQDVEIENKRPILSNSRAAQSTSWYHLRASKGGKAKDVSFIIQPELGATGEPLDHARHIQLVPTDKLDADAEYEVELVSNDNPALTLVIDGKASDLRFSGQKLEVKGKLKEEQNLLSHSGFESSASLLAGDKAGAFTGKLIYGYDDLWDPNRNPGQVWRFRSMLEADITTRPSEPNQYINSIIGDLSGVLVKRTKPALLEGGLVSRLESDQQFNVINGTFGITTWAAVSTPEIGDFARSLCVTRNLSNDYSPDAPIITLNYDYVVSIKKDAISGRRAPSVGQDRVRGRLYWAIKVAHDVDFHFHSILRDPYDFDLLIDVGGIYDFEKRKFSPDTRLSLDISPNVSVKKGKPSLTISYVNGKTTPTFQNYNALLAGLKLPF